MNKKVLGYTVQMSILEESVLKVKKENMKIHPKIQSNAVTPSECYNFSQIKESS